MSSCDPPDEDHPSRSNEKKKDKLSLKYMPIVCKAVETSKQLSARPGVCTMIHMRAGGFEYTGDGDSAVCGYCELKVSNLTSDMKPFHIHSQRKPHCPFVLFIRLLSFLTGTSATELNFLPSRVAILDLLQEIRRRTFSHWQYRVSLPAEQMIEAGFFNCNVGDRVICFYCNLICQQWKPHSDDPYEVHRALSPNCPYVTAKLIRPLTSTLFIDDIIPTETASSNNSSTAASLEPSLSNEIVRTAACNPSYVELPKRQASFASWIHDNLPSVDNFVQAGFFYNGVKNIVTCFYCNGSLQNWGPKDNPLIEHARWFPHCAYAKQLCGDQLHQKIQELKRAQQDRAENKEVRQETGSPDLLNGNKSATSSRRLLIPDVSTLSRLVAARLNLPISRRLLDEKVKLSVIKRCWEDQLRLKHEDFASISDLYIACLILQKQIDHINGNKANITIPSTRMKQIQGQNKRTYEQFSTTIEVTSSEPNTANIDKVKSSQSLNNKTTANQINNQNPSNDLEPSNPCVLCLTEEKRLACIPCGHLATCVPCGHSLRSCPICRREIEAFVRIYL